jgi:hypothetical protein
MNAVSLPPHPVSRSARAFGTVTRKMLHERTCEIAQRAGRTAPYVTQDDYEQAKRELTGDPYALIMDTTIDAGLFYPAAAPSEFPTPSEVHLGSTGHTRGATTTPRMFWGGDRPLAGASC